MQELKQSVRHFNVDVPVFFALVKAVEEIERTGKQFDLCISITVKFDNFLANFTFFQLLDQISVVRQIMLTFEYWLEYLPTTLLCRLLSNF